jgi:hypothetical protein
MTEQKNSQIEQLPAVAEDIPETDPSPPPPRRRGRKKLSDNGGYANQLAIQERNQKIIDAKLNNEPVKEIARRFDLTITAVYSIFRQAGVNLRRQQYMCIDCLREAASGKISSDDVKAAIANRQCLKHYQRSYRLKNRTRIKQRDNEVVPLLDDEGRVVGTTTVKQRRLAAHREAQRRYCQKYPERVKDNLQRYRESLMGEESNRRAARNYRERKRQKKIEEMLELYRPNLTAEPPGEAAVSLDRS